MSLDHEMLKNAFSQVLSGKGAHIGPACALEGIGCEHTGARTDDMPYTIFQLLNHMIYWQDWTIKWLDGQNPTLPEHASLSWTEDVGPKNQKDWEQRILNCRLQMSNCKLSGMLHVPSIRPEQVRVFRSKFYDLRSKL